MFDKMWQIRREKGCVLMKEKKNEIILFEDRSEEHTSELQSH